ncbi:uncharacterized protein N7496_011110 [Penicillium cataractarum]|uniref:Uncharacterized protein n=1 Tax=Penicillium cataractarum TaxID=2100454 RepID=A0A9W9REU8_9EURO|nr:uncharacterized protein N7496_011110 [Penicillium cataractarum]KAJ5358697.1 hypothetical protein N7496_011110 [Penicillium cataractarum]
MVLITIYINRSPASQAQRYIVRDWNNLNDDNRRSLQRVVELDDEADLGSTLLLDCILYRRHISIDDALSIDAASINFLDNDGWSALHWAALKADAELMQKLIDYGAEVDIRSPVGRTALHIIADHGVTLCADVLLKAGANINALDHWGKTPLFQAAQCNVADLLDTLLNHGANPRLSEKSGDTPLHAISYSIRISDISKVDRPVAALIHAGADLNARNEKGMTPVAMAVESGKADVFLALSRLGADLSSVNNAGQTILHLAALCGDLKLLEVMRQVKVSTVDVNQLDHSDTTAEQYFERRVHSGISYKGQVSILTEKEISSFKALCEDMLEIYRTPLVVTTSLSPLISAEDSPSEFFFDAKESF